ncbi:MAG: hypothetical protein ABI863_10445 [Ginsengibacter sp.]
MSKKLHPLFLFIFLCFSVTLFARHTHHHNPTAQNSISSEGAQPLLAQAIRLREALSSLGSSLPVEDDRRSSALQHQPLTQQLLTQCFYLLIS